ncbi:hypothetical protein [Gallaecimonas xiamenensis]|uniref:Lipoprotein n=1 Tax=Gallaecimonas xiamenensis 3-C-1 TaxID=745411 RepID=K2KKR9_9GAMM|nr:hypothetical protein [Gallaecimonas xiamenensis]EKE78015.1 hypothetical protein B3C1_01105 [Gallaecimonas xiamenensis 3-C-1]
MKGRLGLLALLAVAGCQAEQKVPTFGQLQSNLEVTDRNQYQCAAPSLADIRRVLDKGQWTDPQSLHDHYASTGCSVKGQVMQDGQWRSFTFDFGGIIYFDDGRVLACGQGCCSDDFAFCSFDPGVDGQ